MRALANVKSSAITPRQPSVPNLMDAMTLNYTRCERVTNSHIGVKSASQYGHLYRSFASRYLRFHHRTSRVCNSRSAHVRFSPRPGSPPKTIGVVYHLILPV